MYSLSIGVFIMISIGLDLIIQSVKKDIIMNTGSEIFIECVNENYYTSNEIKEDLFNMIKNNYIQYIFLLKHHLFLIYVLKVILQFKIMAKI